MLGQICSTTRLGFSLTVPLSAARTSVTDRPIGRSIDGTDKIWAGAPPLCRDFIERCLVKKPKMRITAAQAQQHPWLQNAARAMERGAPLSKASMMAMLDYQNGNPFKK